MLKKHRNPHALLLIMEITQIECSNNLSLSPIYSLSLQIMPLLSETLCVLSWFSFSRSLNLPKWSVSPRCEQEEQTYECDRISWVSEILYVCNTNKHHAVWFVVSKQCEMQCCRYVSGWMYRSFARSLAHARIPYLYYTKHISNKYNTHRTEKILDGSKQQSFGFVHSVNYQTSYWKGVVGDRVAHILFQLSLWIALNYKRKENANDHIEISCWLINSSPRLRFISSEVFVRISFSGAKFSMQKWIQYKSILSLYSRRRLRNDWLLNRHTRF